jgi:two-component system CheB/CheR fusion protein
VKEKSFLSPEVDHGEYCRISITDNGIGFDNNFKEKIFEIFQRLNNRSHYDGTGIGLAIVKKVIDHHGGMITASAEENVGATFTIVLPLKQKGVLHYKRFL